MIREYVYLNGAPLAQVDAGSPEVLTYLHTDHLGTPRYATNASGVQVWSWNNDAFGTSTPSGSVTVNLRMPGQYFDAESGLFYNWNRYYNQAIGRYISSDPIGLAGGLNTFAYANVNPVTNIDPEGKNVGVLTAPGTLPTLAELCAANPAACIIGAPAAGLLAGYYGLGAIPGIQEAFDKWVEGEGCPVNEMSKGGNQEVGHDYVRGIAKTMPEDYCSNLKQIMQQARRDGNSKLFNDAKATWKKDCRGK